MSNRLKLFNRFIERLIMNTSNNSEKNNIDTLNYTVFEGMTSISSIINSTALNNRKIVKILYDKEKAKKSANKIAFLRHKSDELKFDLIPTDSTEIDNLASGTTHGGIIAICTDRDFLPIESASILTNGFYVMLEGIEDPYNFGYALRSLYAAGVDGVIVPQRNWMSSAGVVCKSSAGASERINIYFDNNGSSVSILKEHGYKIICAAIRDSVSFYDADLTKPLFLIIGGEKRGISSSVLASADQNIRIDYASDFQGSLSAASCAAVLGFEVMRQNKITENFT